jgi:hypothetical protein
MADILRNHQPHTPRQPFQSDSRRKTCSEKTATNVGCDHYAQCPLPQIAADMRGPSQIVVEDHRELPVGEGRRQAIWCFDAAHVFFGRNPKAGYAIAEDRWFYQRFGEEVKAVQMPPPEEQGPYHWPLESTPPNEGIAAMKAAREAAERGNRRTQKA